MSMYRASPTANPRSSRYRYLHRTHIYSLVGDHQIQPGVGWGQRYQPTRPFLVETIFFLLTLAKA